MITLKEFSETDWDAFSGCESNNPLIGDVTLTTGNGKDFEGCIIVDEDDTQIYILGEDDVDITYILKVPYKTAKFIVERMSEGFDSDYLLSIGFEAVRMP